MYIVVIDKHLELTSYTRKFIKSGFFVQRYLDNYRLLRIPHKNKQFTTRGVSFCELGFDISHMADVIYNTKYKEFHKNIFGSNNNLSGFPTILREVFSPIFDIINDIDITYINNEYDPYQIAEAVYLTGMYRKFKKDIDLIIYYLIKLRYKEKIPNQYMDILMNEYPHELIKVI